MRCLDAGGSLIVVVGRALHLLDWRASCRSYACIMRDVQCTTCDVYSYSGVRG